ncbi:MAG: hypothetical protein CL816_04220 [Coxiellaceae bacterium]|nr:hypothetical protein [Coxiellaceae bacterium]|tara:strand:- start:153 stop:1262 length:1110 start_codon:yes stop_codon:yes gene_type:complete
MKYWVSRVKQWILGLLISALFLALALWYCWHLPLVWSSSTLIIPRGAGVNAAIKRVAASNQTYPVQLVALLVKTFGWRMQMHYGEYTLHDHLSLSELLHHIHNKTGLVQHHVTLIEGWTFQQVKQALLHQSSLNTVGLNHSNKTIMQSLGEVALHPEGQFYPDTYQYVWGNSSLSVLRESHRKMKKTLQQAWEKRATGLPYQSSYEALIVASLIEVEAPSKDERPLVAGVILTRLKKGMRLQIDPTVLYGLGKPYGSSITKTDLATITPYNTYRIVGLPPTPIDMPSASSIHAALHPIFQGYLFYVSNGDGTHTFSQNYAQHLRGVARYRKIEAEIKQSKEPLSSSSYTEMFDWRSLMIRSLQWFILNR